MRDIATALQGIAASGLRLTGRSATISWMLVEKNVPLQHCNTFGIAARAETLVRVRNEDDIRQFLAHPLWGHQPVFVLGGGSNVVLTGDVAPVVLKIEIAGMQLLHETDKHWIVQAGAGERWHDLVAWTLAQGYTGLENMGLIPGTVGAAPVQNIGAYGLELQDRFDSLDAVDLATGESFSLNSAQCAFGYRDSVFKHAPAQQIFEWVCEIRRAKLPDPEVIGNAGSFFKNPTVTPEQCEDIIAREPKIVHYPLDNGNVKLAAGWLIDACGWKGKTMGRAGVYDRQALVLVNRGDRHSLDASVTGGEVMTLARALQTSVYERFGIRLEPEPVVI